MPPPEIQRFHGEGGTSATLTRVSTGTGGAWRQGRNDDTGALRAGDEFFGIDNVQVKGANRID